MAANIEEQDDQTIQNDCLLYRRIPIQVNVYMVWHDTEGRWEISSQAFKNHKSNPRALSVHLKSRLDELGLGPEHVVRDPAKFAVAAVTAGFVRQYHQTIQRRSEPADPAHAHVTGEKPGKVQKELARGATWVIPPPDWPWLDGR